MPRQGVRLRAADFVMIPFSLLWRGFAIFWETTILSSKAPAFLDLYMIVGRFFADSYQRARTCYGVTGQRVIIVNGLWGREVKSLALQSLGEISLNERADKGGSITFGPTTRDQ
jgi:hypothetical protein